MQSSSRPPAGLFRCAFADTTTAWNALCPTLEKALNINSCPSFLTNFHKRMHAAEARLRDWALALQSCVRSFVCTAARSKPAVGEETKGQCLLSGCPCALAKRFEIIGSNSDTPLQTEPLNF